MILNSFNKLTYWFIGLILVFTLGCCVYAIFLRPPKFLFAIKEDLISNSQLMQAIGGEQGYQLYYS